LVFDICTQLQLGGHSFELAPEILLTGLRRMRPHLGGQGPHPQHIVRCAIRHSVPNVQTRGPFRLLSG
jgi:hypothetical protein